MKGNLTIFDREYHKPLEVLHKFVDDLAYQDYVSRQVIDSKTPSYMLYGGGGIQATIASALKDQPTTTIMQFIRQTGDADLYLHMTELNVSSLVRDLSTEFETYRWDQKSNIRIGNLDMNYSIDPSDMRRFEGEIARELESSRVVSFPIPGAPSETNDYGFGDLMADVKGFDLNSLSVNSRFKIRVPSPEYLVAAKIGSPGKHIKPKDRADISGLLYALSADSRSIDESELEGIFSRVLVTKPGAASRAMEQYQGIAKESSELYA
jgi:hypothetical protein